MNGSGRDSLLQDFAQILNAGGSSAINIAAYDTAWVARVAIDNNPKVSAFPQALNWLVTHQHHDGSWGEGGICERIIATLAAMVALAEKGHRKQDSHQLESGMAFIWHSILHLNNMTALPVGFELLLGGLVEEGRSLGLNFPTWLTAHYDKYRQEKLNLLRHIPQDQLQHTSAIFSLEFMGTDLPASPQAFVYSNGSIAYSPAATASVLRSVTDPVLRKQMLDYLNNSSISEKGFWGWSNFTRFDIMENTWILYNLHLCGQTDHLVLQDLFMRRLLELEKSWLEEGLSIAPEFIRDGDTTSLGFGILCQYDELRNPSVLEKFWREDHLVTYQYERDFSNSANIHGLEAYRLLGDKTRVGQLVNFLDRSRHQLPFWADKWHSSPYYTTAHAIIASSSLDSEYLQGAVEWLSGTQNQAGGWGMQKATLEETAYALQALLIYVQARGWTQRLRASVGRGLEYLRKNYRPFILDAPPLWISKSRYTPHLMVRAAILSALILGEEHNL